MKNGNKLRQIVYERCNGYCERCGISLHPDDYALHHRKLKSRGGTDELSNLLALHHHCHNLGTNSVHLDPSEATRRGLLVSSWSESLVVPVTLCDGTRVLLTNDGRYKPVRTGELNGE